VIRAILILLALFASTATAQQPAATTGQTAEPLRLENIEKIALERNPTLLQVSAAIRSAQGRSKQAGLYPNPFIAVENPDISFGPVIRGGEWGVVLQQDIVLGGKLGLSRQAAEQDVIKAQVHAEAQRLRVLTSIRGLFYQSLAAQRKVEVRKRLFNLVREAVTTSRQLQNVGQADIPDVLEIEIEEHNAELAVMSAQNEQRQIWVQLGAAVGDPTLPMAPLEGDLENVPEFDAQQILAKLLAESPEVKTAKADIAQAEYTLRRAEKERIPDLSVKGGIHYNRELLEAGGRRIGRQGSLEIGIRLPLFNRNQGNVEAARADLERAQRETERVALSLRSRLAVALRQFQDARNIVEKYREQMLPRARRAYELYLARFRQMAAAYPQALIAQRTLLQLQDDYDEALSNLWQQAVEVEGLLLERGLRAQE
jgi:cobalt-zinc-cadmium efflux system outer membrane protein